MKTLTNVKLHNLSLDASKSSNKKNPGVQIFLHSSLTGSVKV